MRFELNPVISQHTSFAMPGILENAQGTLPQPIVPPEIAPIVGLVCAVLPSFLLAGTVWYLHDRAQRRRPPISRK